MGAARGAPHDCPLSGEIDVPVPAVFQGVSTSLNDLSQRLAILAAPFGYSVKTKLLGGPHGSCLELKASRPAPGGGALEYARLVSLTDLEARGAAVVADDFSRDARRALSGADAPRAADSMDPEKRTARR